MENIVFGDHTVVMFILEFVIIHELSNIILSQPQKNRN